MIAFVSDLDGNRDIYTMNTDGSNKTLLTFDVDWDGEAAWSSDGALIAFSSDSRGTSQVINTMNADGSNQTRITISSTWAFRPAWSPDGTRITFESYRAGKSEIYIMNPDGPTRPASPSAPLLRSATPGRLSHRFRSS